MDDLDSDVFAQNIDEFVEEVEGLYGRTTFFRNDLYLGRSLREYGEWARSEIEFLSSFLSVGSVVVDAGAFIGTHTMAFSRFVGTSGKILSFEPHPWYYRLLTRNVSANDLANVQTYNFGLSDRAETMTVPALDLSSSNSFGSVRLTGATDDSGALRVDVRPLDELQLASCDLIKADVEGMEVRVLTGALQTIDRCQPIVYTECNSGNDAWPVVLLMQSRGYKVYLFATKAYNPANHRHNVFNIFGEAIELGLVSVPLRRAAEFEAKWSSSGSVVPITTFDDLVLCLLRKPQYKEEVLSRTSSAAVWGVDFWLNMPERAALETAIDDAKKRISDLDCAVAAREEKIASLNEAVFDIEHRIASLEQAIVEREGKIAVLNQALVERDNRIAEIYRSRSWRITRPIRIFTKGGRWLIHRSRLFGLATKDIVRRDRVPLAVVWAWPRWRLRPAVGRVVMRAIQSSFTRYAYRSLPLPLRRKQQAKEVFRKMLGWAYRQSGASNTTPRLPGSHASVTQIADGTWEWAEYPSLSARIKSAELARIHSLRLREPKIIKVDERSLRAAATSIHLPNPGNSPKVTIIVPAYNQIRYTIECLISIARCAGDGPSFEVLVANDASTDETRALLKDVPNVRLVTNSANLGFLRNCNNAARVARGEYLVFLNNDVQVTGRWLAAMLGTFASEERVGAVGPKIIYPNGRLQEAGVRIRCDGTADMIGLNDDPDLPRYNYTRDVDYCSGACLMVSTTLFRDLGGFDDALAPAYCEDADLCLRIKQRGLRVVYCPSAVVVHHLSKTSNALDGSYKHKAIARNLQKISEKWQTVLDTMDDVRIIAFYLPQFHPIPQNDLWWGKGFTEWTNVAKAKPNFMGHYQPHLPADLGYYDLRVPEVMDEQARLARRYGIHGFCYYYYWFAGKRLLELPIDRILQTGRPDFPFCLCWANENWTRRWDGMENEILMGQSHSDEDDVAVINDLIRFFRHPNYIRIGGKPLLLIYRVTLFPNFTRTATIWRDVCRKEGIGDIYLAMVESFELVGSDTPPERFGCDASVEFPPQGMADLRAPSGEVLNPQFQGFVADYRDLVARYTSRPAPGYTRFRGVMPGWDNTPRRQDNGICFEYATPGAFQAWVEAAIADTKAQCSGEERLLFVNAWNEWAEGAHLEPDRRFGHTFLEAVRNARESAMLLRRNRYAVE